jgi:hypothetical protein
MAWPLSVYGYLGVNHAGEDVIRNRQGLAAQTPA